MFEYVGLIVLGSLATARLTLLITDDEIARPIRERIWKKYPPATSMFGFAFTCTWCVSMWAAAFLTIAYILIPFIAIVFACILTLSFIASVIDEVRHR